MVRNFDEKTLENLGNVSWNKSIFNIHQNKKNTHEAVCQTFDTHVGNQQSLKDELDKINYKKNK